MDPSFVVARPVHLTFIANTMPTTLQAVQLAEYTHARPQAMVNSLHRYRTHVGQPYAFRVIGRMPHGKGSTPERIQHGIALLPYELAMLWTPARDSRAMRRILEALRRGELDYVPKESSLLLETMSLARRVKQAVDQRQSTLEGTLLQEVELFTGIFPPEATKLDACMAIVYRSERRA